VDSSRKVIHGLFAAFAGAASGKQQAASPDSGVSR
jgi:hypothetical protein